ncbi:glycosyltransferase, group 2 family protein [Paenibacillus larvae subsp. larvae]|uniref:Glycosyltransferase, group 2 family protein n=1 Tax=Paenibacillus larvae subsp. larvae TaxID=147375 RepID=A0A2L1TXZ8_9BACL|nr:glycosyltransferase, group 2 family protein [Paenibacillus larvae subsp. larvae]AVF30321.1 glycosyltransferase, group 2 family protein [Paenibacillus larvae subsp. larvae]MBH0340833.1 hypothetical protein [Paenibacillus larvae]
MQTGAAVFNLPYNLDIGGAVQTRYRHALNEKDFAVQIDGDGQHDPADLFITTAHYRIKRSG